MAQRIRKQIALDEHHQQILKQLAERQGVSEAEVIRRAIEREGDRTSHEGAESPREIWNRILQFVDARKSLGTHGTPYRWNRADAYSERAVYRDRSRDSTGD